MSRVTMRVALLISLISCTVAAQQVPPRKSIPMIAETAKGAVVTIVIGNKDAPIAQGTGFLVRSDGIIATNYHVIANGSMAIVKFSDGTILPIDGLLAADKARDLAIIKIHSDVGISDFRTLTLGNSDQVQIGEDVVVIGNPLGLELTVSNGIVSGIRTAKEEGGKFLQITAPISHGSSGGPLFNMAGEVIGITTMFVEGGENLNFAIPINDTKLLLQNRSAYLQSLPNEAPEPPKRTELPGQQEACSKRGAKFIHYLWPKVRDDQFLSHFDVNSGICFVESGGRLFKGRKPVWTIKINDASSEGSREAPLYGYFVYDSSDPNLSTCYIYNVALREHPGGIPCSSKEEFDDLAFKYFGIPALTSTEFRIPN